MATVSQIAYALMPMSLIGTIVNWSVLYAVLKLQTFNHSFGYLLANQAIVDALHSSMFLLYFCPMILLYSEFFKAISIHSGFIILLSYEISVMTHLAISLNRLCAVWAPYKYQNIFIFCDFYYDEKIHFLTFNDTELCGYIGWYGDFVKNTVIVAVVMFLDLLTVIKVRKMSKKVVANISNQAQTKLSGREMRFLKQTVTQGSAFMLELLTYFFIPQYFTNKWVVFLATSFAWVAIHAVDGIVVLLFNPEVRKFLLITEPKQRTSSTSQTT